MNYRAAKTSRSIRMLTAIILAMAAALMFGGFHDRNLLVGGGLLAIIALVCYLRAPVAYDLSNGCLTVVFHAGKASFGQVRWCDRLTERPPFTIRLLGNGGLFAGAGIFWNKRDGVFRVYATSARWQDSLLVRTRNYKVVITPEGLQAFVEAAGILESASPSESERIR